MSDVFTLERYSEKPTFSSFLPGIAGEAGIPAWCYYNNRGQAVCSFGVSDKDHAIMEFGAAHEAYREVSRTGFRTFIRRDGQVTEAFADGSASMDIRPAELCLRWEDEKTRVEVVYFGLPECRVGALARQVTVTNLGPESSLRLLDGMPAIVCYGVNQDTLKNMPNLGKAWMQVEDAERSLPFYRVRASMQDSAVVTSVEGGNFALGLLADGTKLPVVADPEAVFGYDTSLSRPLGFMADDFDERVTRQQSANLFPCAFFRCDATLGEGESVTLYEVYGQAESKDRVHAFADGIPASEEIPAASWFRYKRELANYFAAALTQAIDGRTADPAFDAYARQSYLDNLLRGGEPVCFADGKKRNIFYLYSRKHGDPEREYNYFVMSPEYLSQGNGNFRDVCQNRRCDVLFHPFVGDADIRTFFSLVQSDGYNPLVIDRMTFRVTSPAALSEVPAERRVEAASLLTGEVTPGQLAMKAEDWGIPDPVRWTHRVLASAKMEPNATFAEGYWTDHWTYSLDLIESYLALWPERKNALLFGARDLPWYETRALVLPEKERVHGKRQTVFLDMARKRGTPNKWMREGMGKGETARSTLMEKMVFLCAVKASTLDREGIGIEMEAGKPGWYDALNGLPALGGSSVAEACELKRLLSFTAEALEQAPAGATLSMYAEMADFVRALDTLPDAPLARHREATALREAYRERTADGVSGERRELSVPETAALLRRPEQTVANGLKRGVERCGCICPTYLMFPDGDAGECLPLFLEGPTRWLKLNAPLVKKRAMAARVRNSGLYDTELKMFKVNESLEHLTYEAGRCRAFTPGWLENESVWLHMEYKYILELMRSGLWTEAEEAMDTALVPYMDPAVYGRSVYENVSFIASSANPDPGIHGRGFCARLSGSTVEFLSMWHLMMFGAQPFRADADGTVSLDLKPFLPGRLIPEDGVVEAAFLEKCRVRYHIPGQESLVPGHYRVAAYEADGAPCDPVTLADRLRRGEVGFLDVMIER